MVGHEGRLLSALIAVLRLLLEEFSLLLELVYEFVLLDNLVLELLKLLVKIIIRLCGQAVTGHHTRTPLTFQIVTLEDEL